MRGGETIFALSSAPGRAGIAVIRISGPAAGDVLTAMAGGKPRPRIATLRRLRDATTGEPLDQALVLWLPAPGSFTGEDAAELQGHGGKAGVAALLGALARLPGLRMAEPGEFARRAFENGKLDLTAIEGLADLIDAETSAQRRQALAQAGGGLARLYDGWRTVLLDARALVEAGIDFADEADVAEQVLVSAITRVRPLRADIARHLDDRNRGEIVRDGFRVVLAGPPNVGKSSVLNALARRDAAIVSDEPGTTRDVVDVRLDIGGLSVLFSDTAGLRATTAKVEREGIRRSLERAASAHLVLWIMDASAPQAQPPDGLAASGRTIWRVHNKIDLVTGAAGMIVDGDAMAISAATGEGLDALVRRIGETALAQTDGGGDGLALTQARHRIEIEACHEHLSRFLEAEADDHELRAEDLRLAGHALGRITGRVDVEDVLDRIFARFCIGK